MRACEIPDMLIGTIAALWRYPIKSLAAQALMEVDVTPAGFAGDRASALVVTTTAHARAGKPYRGKENHLLHTVETPQAAQAFAAAADVEVVAVSGEHFFDAQPISLVFDSWLRDVEQLVGRELDPLRYRTNIFARAVAGFDDREKALVGASLAAGAVGLRVVATIGRCVTTTYDIATGQSDPAVLREVAQKRANTVGVYCTVEQPGILRPGDRIERRP